MVVVAQCNEAERLQGAVSGRPYGCEHFRHASYGTRLSLKSDFDKISLTERFGQPQQTAGDGDSLEFRFGALTVFQHD